MGYINNYYYLMGYNDYNDVYIYILFVSINIPSPTIQPQFLGLGDRSNGKEQMRYRCVARRLGSSNKKAECWVIFWVPNIIKHTFFMDFKDEFLVNNGSSPQYWKKGKVAIMCPCQEWRNRLDHTLFFSWSKISASPVIYIYSILIYSLGIVYIKDCYNTIDYCSIPIAEVYIYIL